MIVDEHTLLVEQVPDFKWCREGGSLDCGGFDVAFKGLIKAA